jgi:hypothetical protein
VEGRWLQGHRLYFTGNGHHRTKEICDINETTIKPSKFFFFLFCFGEIGLCACKAGALPLEPHLQNGYKILKLIVHSEILGLSDLRKEQRTDVMDMAPQGKAHRYKYGYL